MRNTYILKGDGLASLVGAGSRVTLNSAGHRGADHCNASQHGPTPLATHLNNGRVLLSLGDGVAVGPAVGLDAPHLRRISKTIAKCDRQNAIAKRDRTYLKQTLILIAAAGEDLGGIQANWNQCQVLKMSALRSTRHGALASPAGVTLGETGTVPEASAVCSQHECIATCDRA